MLVFVIFVVDKLINWTTLIYLSFSNEQNSICSFFMLKTFLYWLPKSQFIFVDIIIYTVHLSKYFTIKKFVAYFIFNKSTKLYSILYIFIAWYICHIACSSDYTYCLSHSSYLTKSYCLLDKRLLLSHDKGQYITTIGKLEDIQSNLLLLFLSHLC
jgi:hypothetical protein